VSGTAALENLGIELRQQGLVADLVTPASGPAYLEVRNPGAAALSDHIYTQLGFFWFPWPLRIARVGDIPGAVEVITRVLDTAGDDG
jgi:hypothetical protein